MSELAIFTAELEKLEREDRYDAPEYDFLVSKVEELQAAEKAKSAAPATAAPGQTDADPVAKLVTDMQRAALDPDRLTDAERDALVARYNHAVAETERTTERIDTAELVRTMATANANPDALSHAERDQLVRRYNQAIVQGPERRTSEALRGELAGGDLPTRMRVAAALLERGELDDTEAGAVVDAYNSEVQAAAAAVGDPNEYSPRLRPIVEAQQAALRAQQAPTDPVDHATKVFNDFVRAQRPPTLEEQLEALGIQAEPEPQPTSSITQEA